MALVQLSHLAKLTPFLLVAPTASIIWASKNKDPGLQDSFGNFREKMLATGSLPMKNVVYQDNKGEIPQYFPGKPPAEPENGEAPKR